MTDTSSPGARDHLALAVGQQGALAREQVEDGAHCLDVCVATTERSDELEFMKKLVKRLSLEIEAPLVIDSTDPKVIEAAVQQIPGRPIINSINLEGDGSRFHALAPLVESLLLPLRPGVLHSIAGALVAALDRFGEERIIDVVPVPVAGVAT